MSQKGYAWSVSTLNLHMHVQAKIQELRESGLQLAGDTNNNGLFRVRCLTSAVLHRTSTSYFNTHSITQLPSILHHSIMRSFAK